MIKRIVEWLQVMLPPHGLAIFLVGLALSWVLEWAFMGMLYVRYGAVPDDWNLMLGFRGWTIAALFGWGVWRACLINPAYFPAYRQWLETTPWRAEQPLPLGPVQLMWQDALLLIAASLVCWHQPLGWHAPLAFLLPYSLFVTQVNYRSEQDWHALAAVMLAVLLPLAMSYQELPWLTLLLATSIAVIASIGWRQSLNAFPWDHLSRWKDLSFTRKDIQLERASCKWWPLVHPTADYKFGPAATWKEALMTACLWGWLAGAATFTIEDVGSRTPLAINDVLRTASNIAWILSVAIGGCASVLRLMRYLAWCFPPITLPGRFAMRRLIIPGYDHVFIAPAATLLIAASLPPLLMKIGLPPAPTAFLATATSVLAAIGMGPTLASWGLTGEYRMALHIPPSRTARERGNGGVSRTTE